jgi:hypothetical protein
MISIDAEWKQEDPDGSPCHECKEPIYSLPMHTLYLILMKDDFIIIMKLCNGCYLVSDMHDR